MTDECEKSKPTPVFFDLTKRELLASIIASGSDRISFFHIEGVTPDVSKTWDCLPDIADSWVRIADAIIERCKRT